LEQAVINAVAKALDDRIIRAAVDRARQRFREEAKASGERRRHLEQELRAVEAAHVIAAIKQGDAPAPLLDALREQQQRRSALDAELQQLTALEHDAALDDDRLADELAEAAAVFEREGMRGYEFVGTGSYGGLLAGYTSPTSGRGPNGIRALVAT
jgi:hypothetical protein